MKNRVQEVIAVAIVAIACVAVVAGTAWELTSNWNECRAHGFSRFYCWCQRR